MSKVTFADKVSLREVAVAIINKITAANINEIKASVNALYDATGWATYEDGQYTSGSPFTVAQGVTSALPNDADTVTDSQLPAGWTPYSAGVINGEDLGDLLLIDVHFTASSSANDGAFDVILDNGHEQRKTIVFRRNAVTNVHFCTSFVLPVDAAVMADGATLSVESISGNTSIWDIEYTIARIHKGQ